MLEIILCDNLIDPLNLVYVHTTLTKFTKAAILLPLLIIIIV